MRNLLLIAGILSSSAAVAQSVGLSQVIQLNAIPNADSTVTLKWKPLAFSGSYQVFRGSASDPLNFAGPVATLSDKDSVWKDATFKLGNQTEYAIARLNSSNQTMALGYILAGNKTKEKPSHGSIILLIDSNYIQPLAAELAQLKADLRAGGWIINVIYAGRQESVVTVRARIKNVWENAKPMPEYLYLLGRIPVPYSGYFSGNSDRCAYPPDGHVEGSGNHTGAWPADVYYSDLEGFWTDNSINCTTGSENRLHNVPGDGKFDQCAPSSPAALRMGRVDFYGMTFFNKSDTVLMKNYLNRVHNWRIDNIPYVERGLVDDNFTSLDLAGTGYATISSCVNLDSVFNNRDYFTAQNKENYLWSYGCGAGSYTSCAGIGGNNNFNPGIFNNIFTSLAGSFFGDWDAQNSFLRSPLCSGSLLCFWGGIPKWYAHYFGLGLPMGYSTLVTQNSTNASFNFSQNKVHIALMGDPTLTLKSVPPAGKLSVSSVSGQVKLKWFSAQGKFDGYCVYRIDTVKNVWTRVNEAIITDTFYTDGSNWSTGFYKYAVRPIRLEKTGSGSYYNLGGGTFAWINHTNNTRRMEKLNLTVAPNPSNDALTVFLGSEIADASLELTDVTGRVYNNIPWNMLDSKTLAVNVAQCASGVYFLKVTSDKSVGVSKIQIQH